MDPKIFGRGTWSIYFYIIFDTIYKIYNERIKLLNPNSSENSENIELMFNEIDKRETQHLVKLIYTLSNALPCEQICKVHCLENMNKYNLSETENVLYVLHFFIELRQLFYKTKIDRTKYNSLDSALQNREEFLLNILKD